METLPCSQFRVDGNPLETMTDETPLLIVIEQMKIEHRNEIRGEAVVQEVKYEDLLVGRVQDGKLRLGLTDWPEDLA